MMCCVHAVHFRCLPAGDFTDHVLTFLSTGIHLGVIQKLSDDKANDMAALLQLTQSSHAQVRFFGTPHDGMMKQSVWPLWQHAVEVRFVWALPTEMWASKTYNTRDVPQIAGLSPPVPTGRARSKERVETAEGSLSAADESAEDSTAAETRAVGPSKQAIKQLVDRDVALVERRLAACETQFKMAVPVTCCAAPDPPQTPVQGGPQASLSTASSMAKRAASAVPGPRPVRFPPGLSPLSSHSSTLNIKAQMGF